MSPVYAFFHQRPRLTTHQGRKCLEFVCGAPHCKGSGRGEEARIVRRYFGTWDATSTSNLRKHAKKCWGEDVLAKADEAKANKEDVNTIREGLKDIKRRPNGRLEAVFARKGGKAPVTYSTMNHTYEETRYAPIQPK
jgi:hypothetical protein